MAASRLKEGLRQIRDRWLGGAAEGQGLVEYALILVLVVLVAFVVIVGIGPWVGNVFSNIVFNL